MREQLTPGGRTAVLANLSSLSAPVSVSTTDGVLRTADARIDERVATIRQEARDQRLHTSCGGVGGGWGN